MWWTSYDCWYSFEEESYMFAKQNWWYCHFKFLFHECMSIFSDQEMVYSLFILYTYVYLVGRKFVFPPHQFSFTFQIRLFKLCTSHVNKKNSTIVYFWPLSYGRAIRGGDQAVIAFEWSNLRINLIAILIKENCHSTVLVAVVYLILCRFCDINIEMCVFVAITCICIAVRICQRQSESNMPRYICKLNRYDFR